MERPKFTSRTTVVKIRFMNLRSKASWHKTRNTGDENMLPSSLSSIRAAAEANILTEMPRAFKKKRNIEVSGGRIPTMKGLI